MSKSARIILIIIAIILIVVAIFLLLSRGERGDGDGLAFPNFFPFGNRTSPGDQPLPPDQTGPGGGGRPGTEISVDKLIQLTDYPVAGYAILDNETNPERVTARVINARNGHLADITISRDGSVEESVVANTTIPNIEEGYIVGDRHQYAILRYADGGAVKTFLGNVPSSNSVIRTLSGTFLVDGISDVTPSVEDPDTIYYVIPQIDGASVYSYNVAAESSQLLYESKASEIFVHSSSDGVYVSTRPTGYQVGLLFKLTDGTLIPVGDGKPGLTAAKQSPGEKMLTGSGGSDYIRLNSIDTETGRESSFGFTTLPEKCTWSESMSQVFCSVPQNIPPGVYPDDWYQDQTSFTDTIRSVTINGPSFTTTEVLNPLVVEEKVAIDGILLSYDNETSSLILKNKVGGVLWLVRN